MRKKVLLTHTHTQRWTYRLTEADTMEGFDVREISKQDQIHAEKQENRKTRKNRKLSSWQASKSQCPTFNAVLEKRK
jgi:hypothetical protein